MFDLSQQPWSDGVDLTNLGLVAVPGGHVSLTLHELAQGLQPGHIILAIYDTVLRMYNKQPGFYAVNGTGTLTDDSGVIIDPSDPRFSISWTANGKSIPAQDIFSAVVDGIASTAQYEWNQICSYALGVSFSGNVAFHIGPYSSSEGLLCGWIVKTFSFLVIYVVRARREFQEIDFTLSWQGQKMGSGYIMKLSSIESHGGNGTDGKASS